MRSIITLDLVPLSVDNGRRGAVTIDRLIVAPADVLSILTRGSAGLRLDLTDKFASGEARPCRLQGNDSKHWTVSSSQPPWKSGIICTRLIRPLGFVWE